MRFEVLYLVTDNKNEFKMELVFNMGWPKYKGCVPSDFSEMFIKVKKNELARYIHVHAKQK